MFGKMQEKTQKSSQLLDNYLVINIWNIQIAAR